ncbi:MAG TPA: M1 family aminopeptidase [Bellilinea sp.]|nr:M1 family aminopeptidase [Bellilinea sp.]
MIVTTILLSSCKSAPVTTPTATATLQPSATNAPTEVPTPTATIIPDTKLKYEINASLDYGGKYVDVSQRIYMPSLEIAPPNITLLMEPAQYTNGFAVREIQFNGQPQVEYQVGINKIEFIPAVFDAGSQENVIDIKFELYVPRIPQTNYLKSQQYGFTDRQMNLVDWYAALPPQDDAGNWIVHDVYVVGETVVLQIAEFELNLSITGFNKPVVVAASSIPVRTNNDYKYKVPANRSFALSISPEYIVSEGEVNGIRVQSYAFGIFETQNKAVLDYTMQALAFFEEKFGPLDRESLSVVQGDFMDGMEFDGLYFLSKGFYDLDPSLKGYLAMIAIHETSHQWWFAEVGNDQSLEPWLDESMATFSEYLFYAEKHPDTLNWWWQSRVEFFKPTGLINMPVRNYSDYLDYRDSVYLNGAKFLAEVRDYIGAEVFDNAIRDYYGKNKGKIVSSTDFWNSFRNSDKYPFLDKFNKYYR